MTKPNVPVEGTDYERADDIPPGTPHCLWLDATCIAPDGTGYIPSMAYEGVSGHFPLTGRGKHASPWIWGPTLADAQRQVEEANTLLGVTRERALEIVLSSMFSRDR